METLSPYHLDQAQIEAEEKVIAAAKKDSRAFEPLYKNYFGRIAGFVYNRVEDKETAFEITAQVFYKALENLQRYESRGLPFSAWLFRIASNELNQWFRKNKAQRILSVDLNCLVELKGESENAPSHSDEQLFAALERLDEDDLELVNMRFFEKRSFKEISDILGSGESACKMRLYRVLEKLKTILSQATH